VTVVAPATGGGNSLTVDCGSGNHAIGGGARVGVLSIDFPSDSSGTMVANGTTNPRYWTTNFGSSSSNNRAYAICSPN
jgi:hypothetical protein